MMEWTKNYSTMELLEFLKADLEMLYDGDLDPGNTGASLDVVEALMERQEQSNKH